MGFLWWAWLTLAARTSTAKGSSTATCLTQCFDQLRTPLLTRTTRSNSLPPDWPPHWIPIALVDLICFYFYTQMTVHGALASVSSFQAVVSHGCPRDQLHRCVKTAEPLLRNPDYVVPSTTADVSIHCRSANMTKSTTNGWSVYRMSTAKTCKLNIWALLFFSLIPSRIGTEFIDCIRGYAMICLSSDRRQQQLQNALDEAVKNDEMCTNLNYQAGKKVVVLLWKLANNEALSSFFWIAKTDYLKHAPCIKTMATDEGKCRKQLNYLIDQVSALSISNIQICWWARFNISAFCQKKKKTFCYGFPHFSAHHAFRECMLTATDRNCRGSPDGSAVQFTKDMFTKSLAFLLKQCEDYVSVTFPFYSTQ